MTDVQTTVAALRRGAKGRVKALMAMTDEWAFPSRQTFDANGAWSLRFNHRSLVDFENRPDGKHKRTAYRLTPLGLAVRQALEGERTRQLGEQP